MMGNKFTFVVSINTFKPTKHLGEIIYDKKIFC